MLGPVGTFLSTAKVSPLSAAGKRRVADAMEESIVSGRRISRGSSATAVILPILSLPLPRTRSQLVLVGDVVANDTHGHIFIESPLFETINFVAEH